MLDINQVRISISKTMNLSLMDRQYILDVQIRNIVKQGKKTKKSCEKTPPKASQE